MCQLSPKEIWDLRAYVASSFLPTTATEVTLALKLLAFSPDIRPLKAVTMAVTMAVIGRKAQ